MHFTTHKVILNKTKKIDFLKFFIFFSWKNIFSKKFNFFRKKLIFCTFQMILSWFEQKIFFWFFEIFLCPGPDTLDFGSFWKPYRTFNRYILLVVDSIPIDQQLCHTIWSLHYWFGCSDGPKLQYIAKNVIFAISGRFWAWPLCTIFWISIFKLSYDTFPMIEFMYPAP